MILQGNDNYWFSKHSEINAICICILKSNTFKLAGPDTLPRAVAVPTLALLELPQRLWSFALRQHSLETEAPLIYSALPTCCGTALHAGDAQSQNNASFGSLYKFSSKLQTPIKTKPRWKRSGETLWLF